MKFIKRFCSATVKGMDWLCGSMLIVMTILAFIGVLARYVFVVSIPWIDEVTRYLMIWMTFLASAISVSDSSHTSVDILPSFLHKKLKKFENYIVLDVLILVGMAIFFYYNLLMVKGAIAIGNKTPVLMIPMWTMYSSTLVSALFSVLYCIKNIFTRIENIRCALKDTKEDKTC